MQNKLFPRTLLTMLIKWIDRREAYAIKGPRQSGKTTILKLLQHYLITDKQVNPDNIVFLTLEDREILDKFSKNPKEFVRSYIAHKPRERFYFFLDEFQYLNDGGRTLKLLYDLFENIKFIITGSSSLELAEKTAKFMVGRMFSFHLYQLSFAEFINVKSRQLENVYLEKSQLVKKFIARGDPIPIQKDIFLDDLRAQFEEYALYGGYPEVIKTEDNETKKMIIKGIYETYLTHDIIELLKITDVTRFRTIVALLANQIGNLINYNDLASDSQSYFKQIKHFLSVLEETFVIELIKPFYKNRTTELKKNPKVYFIDTGLRNYINRNFNFVDLRSDKGGIIENVVFAQLNIYNFSPIKYWRTLAGAEADFIIEADQNIVPIEVKYSNFKEPKISRGFRSFINVYQPKCAAVLTKNFWGEMKVGDARVAFIPVFYL